MVFFSSQSLKEKKEFLKLQCNSWKKRKSIYFSTHNCFQYAIKNKNSKYKKKRMHVKCVRICKYLHRNNKIEKNQLKIYGTLQQVNGMVRITCFSFDWDITQNTNGFLFFVLFLFKPKTYIMIFESVLVPWTEGKIYTISWILWITWKSCTNKSLINDIENGRMWSCFFFVL